MALNEFLGWVVTVGTIYLAACAVVFVVSLSFFVWLWRGVARRRREHLEHFISLRQRR